MLVIDQNSSLYHPLGISRRSAELSEVCDEVVLDEAGADGFEFLFRVGGAEKVEALRIVCPRIVCTELDS